MKKDFTTTLSKVWAICDKLLCLIKINICKAQINSYLLFHHQMTYNSSTVALRCPLNHSEVVLDLRPLALQVYVLVTHREDHVEVTRKVVGKNDLELIWTLCLAFVGDTSRLSCEPWGVPKKGLQIACAVTNHILFLREKFNIYRAR